MIVENPDDLMRSLEYSMSARRRSELTIDQYRRSFRRFYQWLCERGEPASLAEVEPRHVEEWLVGLAKDLKPATVGWYYRGLRGFYRWHSKREGYSTPFFNIEAPRVPESRKDVVSEADMAKVLKHLRALGRHRDAAIIGLFYDTGMRASEVAGIRTEDIVWGKRGDSFIRLGDTKNGEYRDVPFSYTAGELIDMWLSKRPNPHSPWLFTGRRGTPLTRSGLLQIVKESFQEIGVQGIGPHDLRHTFATHFLDGEGAQVADLMTIGGWKSEQMARHYTKEGKQRRAMKSHRENSPLARLG